MDFRLSAAPGFEITLAIYRPATSDGDIFQPFAPDEPLLAGAVDAIESVRFFRRVFAQVGGLYSQQCRGRRNKQGHVRTQRDLAGQKFAVMQTNRAPAPLAGLNGSLQCFAVVGFSISFGTVLENIVNGSRRLSQVAGTSTGFRGQFADDDCV